MLVRSFYIKDIANIAGPIILGNLGFILIGVGDVIVAGRHSTNTLAAVSLATAIINCIMIFGIGIYAVFQLYFPIIAEQVKKRKNIFTHL